MAPLADRPRRPLHQKLAAAGLAGCIAALAAAARAEAPCTLDRATGTTVEPTPFMTKGYATRWSFAAERLAFMEPDATTGYYRIFTMRPDGTGRTSLTAGRPGLPDKHQGAPYWHPSGRYLLFIAQKEQWSSPRLFGNPDYEALPGFGRHDDLWLITADASRSWRLTDEANTKDEGILLPVFAPDGRHIAWSARQPGGTYRLVLADFIEAPEPHLGKLRTYRPGNGRYYEPGSFASDSASLFYTSDQDSRSFWHSQIYRLDLATGASTRLTSGNDYNEHPVAVATPQGEWVVYMSTRGVNRYPGHWFLGTDWYAVKPDGTGTKRLTTMNVRRKDNPQNAGFMQVATTVAISPAGDYFLGDVQDSLTKQTGMVRVVRFVCAQ